MTTKELRDMTTNHLHDHLKEMRDKLLKLRFGVTNRQVKNMHELKTTQKEIARILTILNEKREQNNV